MIFPPSVVSIPLFRLRIRSGLKPSTGITVKSLLFATELNPSFRANLPRI